MMVLSGMSNMNQLLDKILSSKVSITILSFVMAAVLFYSVSGKDILTSPTSGATLENVPVYVENLDDSLEASGMKVYQLFWLDHR